MYPVWVRLPRHLAPLATVAHPLSVIPSLRRNTPSLACVKHVRTISSSTSKIRLALPLKIGYNTRMNNSYNQFSKFDEIDAFLADEAAAKGSVASVDLVADKELASLMAELWLEEKQEQSAHTLRQQEEDEREDERNQFDDYYSNYAYEMEG